MIIGSTEPGFLLILVKNPDLQGQRKGLSWTPQAEVAPPTPRLEARLLGLMLRLLIEGDPVGAVLAAAKLELRVLDLGVGAPPLVGVLGRRGGGGGDAVDLRGSNRRRQAKASSPPRAPSPPTALRFKR